MMSDRGERRSQRRQLDQLPFPQLRVGGDDCLLLREPMTLGEHFVLDIR